MSDHGRSRRAFVAALIAVGVGVGCSSSDETLPPAPSQADAGGPGTSTTPAAPFRVQALEGCGAAGTQSVAAVSGSKVAFASLAPTTKSNPCTTMNGVSEVQIWDVCYAASDGQGKFATTVVTSQPYLTPTGVGLAFDPSGEANLAFTGGVPAKLRCGAGELFLAKTSGGTFGTPTRVVSGSGSGGLVPDQAADCVQNVCNSGDATGFWPAIGFDPGGQAKVAFRDLHFGFAFDDFASSDVELATGPGFSTYTVDVSHGGGAYMRLAFTPAGKAVVAHYAGDGRQPSLWVNRETASGWERQKIADGKVGEQLGFGASSKGVLALAYYDEAAQRLKYMESTDEGANWVTGANVDLDGLTGFYPSLAFDPDGDPAIAYYRCNAKGPSDSNCDASNDGLYLARRKGGSWQVQAVRAESGIFEGLYPALVFVGGKAVIAYQARSFDPASGQNTVSWWVAEEP